jgi:hypothetical protein
MSGSTTVSVDLESDVDNTENAGGCKRYPSLQMQLQCCVLGPSGFRIGDEKIILN